MVDYTNIGFENLIYPYPAGTDNTGNAFNPSQLDPGTVGFRLSLDVSGLDGTFAVQTTGNTQDLFEVSNEGGYVTADGDDIFQWGGDEFKGVAMGPGNDTVTGSGIAEIMAYGGTGDDSIIGGSEADTIQGDGYDSADLANPNSLFVPTDPVTVDGNDTLFGVGGNDTIMGDGGNDQVYGGTGSDTVSGGAGNDFLSGGPRGDGDTDLVTGGTGADAFLLSYNADGAGDSNFWNDFAGHLLETVGGEAVGEAVSSFIENGVEEITESAVGVAGFAGGAGFLAEGFVELLTDLLATKKPRNSEDVLVIPDFDPSEDVLILPIEENVALTGMVMNFTQTAVGGFSGWGIEFSADNAPYAQVLLSSTYLESMGVTEENGMSQLNRLLSQQVRLNQNATIDGVNFPDGVLKSTNLTDFGGTYTPPAGAQLPGETKAALFGAYGPLLGVTATSTNVAPIGGTIYGDVISLNDKIIDPETFQASDSNDIGGYAHGFAGGDLIYGTRNNDTIFGGEGNDTIYTFDSSPTGPNAADVVKETIDAGDGDDIVYTGGSAGPFDGGTGSDTLAFFYGTLIDPLKVEVDFTAATPYAYERAPSDNSPPGTNINTLGNYYAFTNFETVIGGPLDDWMKGDSSGLTLEGGAGADTIDGGGASLAGFSTSPAGVTANMFTGVYSGGDAAGDTITNVAGLVGSNFDDVLTDSGVSILTGLGGADTFAYYYTPTSVFQAEITDFSAADGDKLDLRPQGITAFDQVDVFNNNDPINLAVTDLSGTILEIKMDITGITVGNFIFADAVSGQVRGTAADDAFVGGAADDELIGKGGNDHLFGGGGDDTLIGNAGVDILDGQDGDDYGRGGRDRDLLRGGDGDDTLRGNQGDDTIEGGDDDDRLIGGGGDDTLDGGDGFDWLSGGTGDDALSGGDGNDILVGGRGDDTLIGGKAADGLRGGKGADLFVIDELSWLPDTIVDFKAHHGDRISFGPLIDTLGLRDEPDIDGLFDASRAGPNIRITLDTNGEGESGGVETVAYLLWPGVADPDTLLDEYVTTDPLLH